MFEGVSARELLQLELSSENDKLVKQLISDFRAVKQMYVQNSRDAPMHANMPPTVSKLVWVICLVFKNAKIAKANYNV